MKLYVLRHAALALACLFGVAAATAQTGYTTVSGSHLHDATGTLVTNSTIRFQPVNSQGVPVSFRAGGAGGQTIAYPVSTTVTSGSFSIVLADTTLTSPANPCYSVSIISNLTGRIDPFPGYSCIQPSGSTWSFDTYTPSTAALPLQLTGCSIAVGSVTVLATGATPTVANAGSACAATLNFGLPAGSGGGGGGSYDPAGSAASAITTAESYAASAASSAQSNAQAYAAALAPIVAGGTSGNVWTSQGGSTPPHWAAAGGAAAFGTLASGTNNGGSFLCGTGCAFNTTGQGSIVASNGPVNLVPVERFGAVADYSGPGGGTGTGTDNTSAIQNCINYVQSTLGSGQCLLKPGNYRITSALSITQSNVGIAGSSAGLVLLAGVPTQPANVPASVIYIDSATADGIDVNLSGTVSTPLANNKFTSFTIMRTKAPTTAGSGCGSGVGPAGLSLSFVGGFVIDQVVSEDSACNFYFNGSGSSAGVGYVANSASLWGYNGFNPAITVYGFNVSGANNANSLRIRHTHSTTNNIPGITSYGLYASGVHLTDIFLDNFETAFQTYGRYWNFTGSGFAQSTDLHDINGISDSSYVSCVYVNGLAAATQGSLEVSGGYCDSNTASSKLIDIENSSGVTVANMQFLPNGSGAVGIRAANSSHLAITGNNIVGLSVSGAASIQLATVSDSTIGNNVMSANSGYPVTTFIAATSLTNSSLIGNSISGYGTTGISLDSASSNNMTLNAIDTAHITFAYSNAGTNNQVFTSASVGSSSTWPPTAPAPTFSPSAGAITPGTTVTAACSSGTPYISTGTAAVAGGTGITVSSAETLYGSCQGSGYFTTGSAAYTATTTTYINTTFNEASAGAALAGTTPATCASGCVGPWALLNGNDWLYQSGGGAAITVTSANADYINTGQANETIRWAITSSSSVNLNLLAHLTHTATTYYFKVAMNGSTGSVSPFNVASGVGTAACSSIAGTVVGSYVLVLSGTSFALTAPSGSCSGSLSASATGTEVGFAADAGASALSAFSVKSN
jgi:hypothetical protein